LQQGVLAMMKRWAGLAFAAVLAVAWVPLASAQAWPTKPVRVVLGYTAGGANDGAMRPLGKLMETLLGQPIVMEFRPGVAGGVAAEYTAKAAPDGYTLYFTGSGSLVINPHLNKVGYDPMQSFTALGAVCVLPTLLVVHPSVPARTVAELVALTKREPGKWSYGTSGVAGPHHMGGEYFKSVTGASLLHIPYKGGAPAMTDLIGGQVPILFTSLGPAVQPVKAGRIRALAITTAKRSPAFPEVPTLDEAGLKGFDSGSWLGLVGPAGMAPEVVQRISQAILKAGEDRGLQENLRGQGCEPEFTTPSQMQEKIRTDFAKWGRLIKDANIKVE
jgi:tripartite-type tricarboxylate transporter receptor subunit TctC